ncbi:MAG: NAD(P)H-hydrate epimerase [Trueperaceae bacterium]|nr:NAD(P)H-hydrate epimerase [Trueperaceae bacterium]
MTIALDAAHPWTATADPSFTTHMGEVIPAVTCAEMRDVEARWFAHREAGADRFAALAGERLATVVAGFQTAGPLRVTVAVGGGWNGAAGAHAALALAESGHAVTLVPVAPARSDAWRAASRRLPHAFVRIAALAELEAALSSADVVVDALIGCGVRGRVRPAMAEVIRSVNRFSRRIVSADVPAGLDGDSGVPWGPAVRPTVTVAFGLPKVGMADARADLSRLLLADVGLPASVLAAFGLERVAPFRHGPIVPLRCRNGDGGRCRDAGFAVPS